MFLATKLSTKGGLGLNNHECYLMLQEHEYKLWGFSGSDFNGLTVSEF